MTKSIVFYTDNKLDDSSLGKMVRDHLLTIGLPIYSVSLKPLDFGNNIVLPLERGFKTLFTQILGGLKASTSDYVFLCEHDVLYHPTHFDFTPPRDDVYYYNMNSWIVRQSDGFSVYYDHKCQGAMCANREFLIKHYTKRLELIEKNGFSMKMGFEAGTHNRPERVDDYKAEGWRSEFPNLDIKHGGNSTPQRFSRDQFRDQRNCRNWEEKSVFDINGWNVEKLKSIIG